MTGKVVRVSGEGLQRVDETKSAAGRRTVPVPQFAVEILRIRRRLPYLSEQAVIFPSTAGTLRDPNNFGKQWRNVREELGVPEVNTEHRTHIPHRRPHSCGMDSSLHEYKLRRR